MMPPRLVRVTRLVSPQVSALVGFTMFALAPAPSRAEPVVTPVGEATWSLTDFHTFSAPFGTEESGYAEFIQTAASIMPPPNHQLHPRLGVGPGAPHAGPYDNEMAEGLAALGIADQATFTPDQFSNGNGVFFIFMAVPDPGTTGSSPDFESGPIIANDLFPLHVTYEISREGVVFPSAGAFDVPALDDQLNPPFDVDGHSHVPFFFGDNYDFAPPGTPIEGEYTFTLTFRDSQGNGYDVSSSFTVSGGVNPIPLPAAVWSGGGVLGALAMGRAARRRLGRTAQA